MRIIRRIEVFKLAIILLYLSFSYSGFSQTNTANQTEIFQEFKDNGKYKKVYLITWSKEDDREVRKQILFLIGGAVTGLAKQIFSSFSTLIDKWLDDLGDDYDDNEESDKRVEFEFKKLGDSVEGYHPVYSYKATVNNNRSVYFVVGEYTFVGFKRWDVVMITDKYIISTENRDSKLVKMKRLGGQKKTYRFSSSLPKRIEVLKTKMDELENSNDNLFFWKKRR